MNHQQSLYLSICIPALGRIDYVRNTLKSIYCERNLNEVKMTDYEVILSDNDPNCSLQVLSKEFPFPNFHYYSTTCDGFMNSFYCLNYGCGELLKLHNSQELWNNGSLGYIIEFVKKYRNEKPALFFTSGLLKNGLINIYKSFNDYMYNLSYLSSWSNGFCIWKENFNRVDKSLTINNFFPHTSLLLTQHSNNNFIIDDRPLFTTQFVSKRGGHNKFHAFSVEYPSLIEFAFKNELITNSTKRHIFRDILYDYLPLLFFNVKIARRETFSSENFREEIEIYFPSYAYHLVVFLSFFIPFKVMWRKFKIRYIMKSDFS